MTTQATKTAGVRSPGRAPIAARTLRTDRWWAYPLTTFGVLLVYHEPFPAGANAMAPLEPDVMSLNGLDLPAGAAEVSGSDGAA